jgi:hypothetical protein
MNRISFNIAFPFFDTTTIPYPFPEVNTFFSTFYMETSASLFLIAPIFYHHHLEISREFLDFFCSMFSVGIKPFEMPMQCFIFQKDIVPYLKKYNNTGEKYMKIDIKELENDLKRVYEKLGKPPSIKEYLTHGEYGKNTIYRAWNGSWNNALLSVIGKINIEKPAPLKNISCKHCKKEFMPNWGKQEYCSVSCANKCVPRRKKTKKCKICQTLIFSDYTYCPKCIKERNEKLSNTQLSSFIEKRNDANRFGQIREHARKIMKNEPQICIICGYSKHVEVAHRKDIKDFSSTTLIKEINDKKNLILLCPNCHWEFDHNKKS